MKICHKCHVLKDASEFHRSQVNKDGLQSACKTCSWEQVRSWRDRNRDHFNARRRATKARQRGTC